MQKQNPQSQESRYRSSFRSIVHNSPRIRHDNSADIDDLRIDMDGSDVYGRTEAQSYLGSDTIAESRKRRRRKRIIATASISLAVVVILAGIAALAFFSNISGKLQSGMDPSLYSELTPVDSPEDPFYVLLLGIDRSEERAESDEFSGDAFRSDSMMLARIDPKNTKVTILSIHRDLKVDMGEYGENKINAAHAIGGPTLAVKTVSKLAGVPISHYAEIDFEGFAEIVDSVGGVEVDVPIEIDDDEAGGYLAPGLQTLNGEQALILCRSRHSYDDYGDGDLYRAANQRVVLSAIAQKLLASDPITIASSLNSLANYVQTDMDVPSIIAIAQNMRGIDSSTDIYSAMTPTESEYIDDVWYEILDKDEWRKIMRRVEAGMSPTESDEIDPETGTIMSVTGNGNASENPAGTSASKVDSSQSINIRNGNGTEGLSSDAERILRSMGYRNFDTGNADSFDYEETIVIYKDPDDEEYAEAIVDALGHGEAIPDDGTYLFNSDYLVVIGADWTL